MQPLRYQQLPRGTPASNVSLSLVETDTTAIQSIMIGVLGICLLCAVWLRRTFPAAPALTVLTAIAVSKILVTKHILLSIDTPVALSLLSCGVTAFAILPYVMYDGGIPRLSIQHRCHLISVCTAVALDLACTNIALSVLPIALHQGIKATVPAVTVLLETVMARRYYSAVTYVSIGVICAGAVTMAADQPWDVRSHDLLSGTVSMTVAVVAGSLKYVLASRILQEQRHTFGVLGFTLWMEIFTAGFLVPWSVMAGELQQMLQRMQNDASQTAVLLGTAAFGGVRILAQFFVLAKTSPTSLSASTIAVQIISTLCAYPLFDSYYSHLTWIGMSLSVLGSVLYVTERVKERSFEYRQESTCDAPCDNVRQPDPHVESPKVKPCENDTRLLRA